MKNCPYCAEEIQDEAIKCKHCGEFLDGRGNTSTKIPWYRSGGSIVMALLVMGPFALPLIWTHPSYSRNKKIIITIIILIITYWLYLVCRDTMAEFKKQFEMLGI